MASRGGRHRINDTPNPGWSANRKLSGFHGETSPVKSASLQRLVGHSWRVYREQSAKLEALLPVCPSSAHNRRKALSKRPISEKRANRVCGRNLQRPTIDDQVARTCRVC
jgi:hypothetical protein